MNKTIKNVLIFGIPIVIIIIVVILVIKEIKGQKSSCPLGQYTAFDGTCLQCNPEDPDCAVCTKNDDCNGGTCYTNDTPGGTGKGVCICTKGRSGLTCQNYCESSDDCNGQPCVDGKCRCDNNMAPPDCKNPPDMSKCGAPNCNSIIITKMKNIGSVTGTTNNTVKIMYTGTDQNGENKIFKQGDILTLGGFITGWVQLNDVQATVQTSETHSNKNEKCWNYCCNTDSQDCEDPFGPFYPNTYPQVLLPQLKCNVPDTCGTESKCFANNCPLYNIVTVTMNSTKANLMKAGSEYSYMGATTWNSSAYFSFKDNTSNCYNNTINGGSDPALCETCKSDWGPGKGVMDTQYPAGKQQPPGGICGRKYPEVGIATSADHSTSSNADCQSLFGPDSCIVSGTTCQPLNPPFPGSKVKPFNVCATDKFWSYPGSNCQTGSWNKCEQCLAQRTGGSLNAPDFGYGEKPFSNQQFGCGAIKDSTLYPNDCSTNNIPTVPNSNISGDDAQTCNIPTNLLPSFQ